MTKEVAENYTIETLMLINEHYHSEHGVRQSDVDAANDCKSAIEASRTDNQVQPGDIVELTTIHGDYYRNAHIANWDENEGQWYICNQPYTPYVYIDKSAGSIGYTLGGGGWRHVPSNLALIGKRKKLFGQWGHKGVCGAGSFLFEATVNVWEYKEPEPLFGEYTTEHYDRWYISHCVDKFGKPQGGYEYQCFSRGTGFATKAEYKAWLRTFRGVEFKVDSLPGQVVVFVYKRIEKLISKEEYEALKLPTDTRVCNGIIEVKVSYDDEARTVTEYRHTNCGKAKQKA